MAQIDFLKLASQGRAYDATRAWTEEELLAVEALVAHGLTRLVAAEYVRNGITTVALYEAAQAAGLETKSLDELRADAIAAHQEKVREQLGALTPETETVATEPEAEEVVSEVEVETETVATEPEAEEVASEVEVEVEEEVAEQPAPVTKRGNKK